jgi:hypothetical protein
VFAGHGINLSARKRRFGGQPQQTSDFVQMEAEGAAAHDEIQTLHIGDGVLPVAGQGARWGWHQSNPLVVADGFQMATRFLRQLTDAHGLTLYLLRTLA